MKTIASILLLAFALVLGAPAPAFAGRGASGGKSPGRVKRAIASVNDRAVKVLDRHPGKVAVLFTVAAGASQIISITSPSPAMRWAAGSASVLAALGALGAGIVKGVKVVLDKSP